MLFTSPPLNLVLIYVKCCSLKRPLVAVWNQGRIQVEHYRKFLTALANVEEIAQVNTNLWYVQTVGTIKEVKRVIFFFTKHTRNSGSEELVMTTHHASQCIGQQRSSSAPVCHWPASGWCPSCGSCSSFSLPQLLARLSSVYRTSTSPLGSSMY